MIAQLKPFFNRRPRLKRALLWLYFAAWRPYHGLRHCVSACHHLARRLWGLSTDRTDRMGRQAARARRLAGKGDWEGAADIWHSLASAGARGGEARIAGAAAGIGGGAERAGRAAGARLDGIRQMPLAVAAFG